MTGKTGSRSPAVSSCRSYRDQGQCKASVRKERSSWAVNWVTSLGYNTEPYLVSTNEPAFKAQIRLKYHRREQPAIRPIELTTAPRSAVANQTHTTKNNNPRQYVKPRGVSTGRCRPRSRKKNLRSETASSAKPTPDPPPPMRPSIASTRVSHAPGSQPPPPSAALLARLADKKKELEAVEALQRASALFLRRLEGLADDCEAMAEAGIGASLFPFFGAGAALPPPFFSSRPVSCHLLIWTRTD